MRLRLTALLVLSLCAFAQQPTEPAVPTGDVKARTRAARDLGKQGTTALPSLQAMLGDPEASVRLAVVDAIVEAGTLQSLEPLLAATRDSDAEVQIRATQGIVNAYVPGYVKRGLIGGLQRTGTNLKGRFTDTNTDLLEPGITVRPNVVQGLARLVSGAMSMEARATAARAVGILRGRQAVPELVAALRAKDDQLIYESVIALQKIREPRVGPDLTFLVRDLNERIQVAAIETVGLLLHRGALPDLRQAYERARNGRVRRAALTAIAVMPDEANRPLFTPLLADEDAGLRAGAVEGLARLRNPRDLPTFQSAFDAERKMAPRLALAFALSLQNQLALSELSPLRYLISTLNNRNYRDVAQPYLVELARDEVLRKTLYTAVKGATRDEKTQLAQVFAASGGKDTLPTLEALANDTDAEVAREGARALRLLRARVS